MQSLLTSVAAIKPLKIMAYVDRIHVWLRIPLTAAELAWLDRHCAPSPAPLNELAAFGDYQQRLELVLPDAEALRFLAKRTHHLNYVELALDWLLQNEETLRATGLIIKGHLIKRHHREKHGVEYVQDTTYLGRPTDKVRPVSYGDLPCRHTGRPHCIHLEFRLKNVQTLHRAGIRSITDLLKFDHHGFWEKRLVLAELDYGYFGRMLATRDDGRWRRRKTTDADYAIGLKHFERVGKGSTQKTVDVYRKHLPLISRCLMLANVTHLLPEKPLHITTIRQHNSTLKRFPVILQHIRHA